MTTTLDGAARALFDDKNWAHVSIVRRDGTVQTVVAWVSVDDAGRLELNSAEGRSWPANLRRTGTATLSVLNPANPMEYAAVVGTVVEDTHDGADAHIDALAGKYLGLDAYPYRQPGEQRVKFVLQPTRVTHQAP